MAQIFHPSFNTISKVSIFGAIFFLGAAVWAWDAMLRSPYTTQVNVAREQPVPFSHKHHVQGLGIDCRYCHDDVEKSSFANLPTTQTCMNCHNQIKKDSAQLAPLRESWETGKPVEWVQVHELGDFVFFDHSVHVNRGVSCLSCHGQVNEMKVVRDVKPLSMAWCLECHKAPEHYLRPLEEVPHQPGKGVPVFALSG